MKVSLRKDGRSYAAETPPPGSAYAVVPAAGCDACGEKPLRARGTGIRETTHDTYVADAVCQACGAPAGVLRVTVSTIFGIEEDERVLRGRCRVY